MLFRYDILTEPWLPVEMTDGAMRGMGLLEALEHAHEIRAIRTPSPPSSLGVLRLLIAFVLDALRPETAYDIADLVAVGRFDGEALRSYVDRCKSEGVSFDLFDESRPFLQSTFPPEDQETQLAVQIFLEIPAGNNHIHFRHQYEADHAFTPTQCLMALTQLASFALMYGRSVSMSINGVPPTYFLYGGRTLFETIALSLVPLSDDDLEGPKVAWRNFEPVPEGGMATGASVLSGLTAQPRRVRLIPEASDGVVVIRRIFYKKGYDYKGLAFPDPHVAYYTNDKGEKRAVTPREDRALWRDLGTMVSRNAKCMLLDTLEHSLSGLTVRPNAMPLRAFSLVTRQKGATRAAIEWSEEELPLRAYLIQNRDRAEVFVGMLRLMESGANCLASVFRKPLKALRGEKANKKTTGMFACFADEAKLACLARCFGALNTRFLDALEEVDITQDEPVRLLRESFASEMKGASLEVFWEYARRVQPGARALEWQASAERSLRAILSKLTKGEKPDETGTSQGDANEA